MLLDKNNEKQVEKYNEFVRNSKYAKLAQDMNWAYVKSGWDSHFFYIEENDEIKACLSVLSIMDNRVNKRLFYANRGPVCDLNDIETVKRLIQEAKEYAKEHDGFLLRIDPEVEYDEKLDKLYKENGLEFKRDPEISSQPLLSTALDIKGRSIDEIFKNFSKNTRKHIRHSYRENLVTRVGDRSDLPKFYEMICAMSQRQDINHRPYEYFERLYDAYEDNMRLSFTELDGKALCASMLIGYGNKCFAIYGGSDNSIGNLGQNYQLNYEEIKYTVENGYEQYDMGGIFSTDENDGLYAFKRKFTEDTVKHWIGEIDVVIDNKKYEQFITYKKPHFSNNQ
ncbi:MAG: peptidoglycan bridge formation glycyltransferase FemA/FemB family protein [Tissierellia bacterium]|nr:peptidoglycan bridge formation glycyltransferase FemA/FemB family protein [Tissierellia bacterium]